MKKVTKMVWKKQSQNIMSKNEIKSSRWSKGNQLFFLDEYAYGVTEELVNICLGKEEEVVKALNESMKTNNPILNQILSLEKMVMEGYHDTTRRTRMAKEGCQRMS